MLILDINYNFLTFHYRLLNNIFIISLSIYSNISNILITYSTKNIVLLKLELTDFIIIDNDIAKYIYSDLNFVFYYL